MPETWGFAQNPLVNDPQVKPAFAAVSAICCCVDTPDVVVHCRPSLAQTPSHVTPVPDDRYHSGSAVGEILGSAPTVAVPVPVLERVAAGVPVFEGVVEGVEAPVPEGDAPKDSVGVAE